MLQAIQEVEEIRSDPQLSRVQFFLKQLRNARLESSWNLTLEKILWVSSWFLDAPLAFLGRMEGNTFKIILKLRKGKRSLFHLPIHMSYQSFLRTLFFQDLPYCSNHVLFDPFVPYLMKSFLVRNLIAVPVEANGERYALLFSDMDTTGDIGLIKKREIEVIQAEVSSNLVALSCELQALKQAETDPSTGLPNVRGLHRQFQDISLQEHPIALMVLELDHWNKMNFHYGKEAAESALQVLACCLKEEAQDEIQAFHIAENRFAVLVPNETEEVVIHLAESIQKNLGLFRLPGGSLTVSIGICLTNNPTALDLLLSFAGEAMERAKIAGGNRIEAFLC